MNSELENILAHFPSSIFEISSFENENEYFPEYLNNKFQKWLTIVKPTLDKIDYTKNEFFTKEFSDEILISLNRQIERFIETIKLYYEGKVYNATQAFNQAMHSLLHENEFPPSIIENKFVFYRARKSNETGFTKKDIFHIPFEERHKVGTNRYSIPGLPALYFGNNTYVCWEEYNRSRLRDLWFSKFECTRELKVIEIQRFEDLKKQLIAGNLTIKHFLRFLISFPLTIACTCKVKHINAHFKSEYLIPQLLLQYAREDNKIDGIKFPSSKINYSLLQNVEAYNFVFPVKTNKATGYCEDLKNLFHLSEPTSIEMEEVHDNAKYPIAHLYSGASEPTKHIQLIKGVPALYENTSFGNLEETLKTRNVEKLQ